MARESKRATAGGVAEGNLCPACGQGVLVKIGQTVDGDVLRCFMCERQQSVHSDAGHEDVLTDVNRQAPSGLTLSPGQHDAATSERDPEQARQQADTSGSGG